MKIATGALISLLVLTGCSEPEPDPIEITGTMTVRADLTTEQFINGVAEGVACDVPDGYDDIPGAQVVVSDPAGVQLAVGQLTPGRMTNTEGDSILARCTFDFTVRDVPGGLELYQVEVADRGAVTYPAEKVTEPIELTLR